MAMWKLVKTIPLLAVVIMMLGCGDLTATTNETPLPTPKKPMPVLEIPTDGTWDLGGSRSDTAGFGTWSTARPNGHNFEFMIDTPPTVTQAGTALSMESQVHVRRVKWHQKFDVGFPNIHSKFQPGESMNFTGGGGLNYDEVYGETRLVCPVDEIGVGETTTCTVSFLEEHPDWVTNSYWRLLGVSVGAWPSQTVAVTGEP